MFSIFISGVEKMYRKGKWPIKGPDHKRDDWNIYDEEVIDRDEEDGVLNPEDAGILRGNTKGSIYSEEEEE